ncbi:MAG: LysR substrate-binding domain-containing protein [Thiobacillaceae bacterium]|jgi:LysR family transcriptional regulator for bpeEF and oprC|nr:LysR substrate-binding domain-containing protein [Thiobacillaceae bacterium]
MDQLVAMRVFSQVAERGSFGKAADALDISRAAASAHVAALEKHLGVRLLNRTTRKVSMTAEGADYLRRCRRILDEIRDAEETLRESRSKPQGLLRVDVPVAFGRYLLLPALPEFTRRYPAIDLDIRLNDRIVDLVAERVDVAVRVGGLQQSGLVARRVAQVNIVTCAAPTYLADRGEPQTPDDLREHRLLALTPPGGGSPEWNFPAPYTARRLKLHYAMLFNAAEAPIVSAAAGLGITHTADLLVAEYVARGELQLILEKFILPGPPISLVYPSAGHQAAKVRVFSDFAADLMRRYHEIVRKRLQPNAS